MRITREEQILNFSMNQIIELLYNEEDALSKCISVRLEELYLGYLDTIAKLQDHVDNLENDIDAIVEVVNKYNFLEGDK